MTMEDELNSKEFMDLLSFPLTVFDGEDALFSTEEESSNLSGEEEDSSATDDQPITQGVNQNKRKQAKKTDNKKKKKRRGKPKRPVSAYILYFQVERKRILENRDDEPLVITPEEVLKVCQEFKAKPKRKHRKSHGQIAFLDLSRTVANRWKNLDKPTKSLFKAQAELETAHYRKLLESWKQKCDEEDAREEERRADLQRQEPPAKKTRVAVHKDDGASRNYQPIALMDETAGAHTSGSLHSQAPPVFHSQSPKNGFDSSMAHYVPSVMEPRPIFEQQGLPQGGDQGTNDNIYMLSKYHQLQGYHQQISSNTMNGGMDCYSHLPRRPPSSATRLVSETDQETSHIVTTPLINSSGLVASEGAPAHVDFRQLCASLCGV